MKAAAALFLLLPTLAAGAAEPAAQADPLEEVLVEGEQPGPGLWKVHAGDNIVWILGSYQPLPQKMTWRSRQVEQIIAGSQAVIAPADVDADISMWTGLRLVRAMLRARALPDGRTLDQVLPPELHARWQVQKKRYLGDKEKIERWRPIFAAGQMYGPAIRSAGLSARDVVWPVVERAAKRHDVPVRRPEILLEFENPRALIEEFSKTPAAGEIACFDGLLTRIERDLPMMQERANAWAVGDVKRLRSLPVEEVESPCLSVFSAAPSVQRKVEEAVRRVRQEWLLAVEGSLLRNPSTLAVVPIRELLHPDGLLQKLAALGYRIEEPE